MLLTSTFLLLAIFVVSAIILIPRIAPKHSLPLPPGPPSATLDPSDNRPSRRQAAPARWRTGRRRARTRARHRRRRHTKSSIATFHRALPVELRREAARRCTPLHAPTTPEPEPVGRSRQASPVARWQIAQIAQMPSNNCLPSFLPFLPPHHHRDKRHHPPLTALSPPPTGRPPRDRRR